MGKLVVYIIYQKKIKMSTSKKYSKTEDLFILDSLLKYSSLQEGSEKIGTVLNRSPKGIIQRFYDLKKAFPDHPACTKNWRVKEHKPKLKWYQKIFKLFGHGNKNA